ncbi:unnamed protein product [Protopolystoma xenopodis]|uniref:Uncharacterized protein n=1 Tax=Protopolystoma xenopodis TaxID=117903 RepID=A0A3S5B5X6_9PLAT|nr:unnamed protein product [Protopolystoma xenopodis]
MAPRVAFDHGEPSLQTSGALRILVMPPLLGDGQSSDSLNRFTMNLFPAFGQDGAASSSRREANYRQDSSAILPTFDSASFSLSSFASSSSAGATETGLSDEALPDLTGLGAILALICAVGVFVCLLLLVTVTVMCRRRKRQFRLHQLHPANESSRLAGASPHAPHTTSISGLTPSLRRQQSISPACLVPTDELAPGLVSGFVDSFLKPGLSTPIHLPASYLVDPVTRLDQVGLIGLLEPSPLTAPTSAISDLSSPPTRPQRQASFHHLTQLQAHVKPHSLQHQQQRQNQSTFNPHSFNRCLSSPTANLGREIGAVGEVGLFTKIVDANPPAALLFNLPPQHSPTSNMESMHRPGCSSEQLFNDYTPLTTEFRCTVSSHLHSDRTGSGPSNTWQPADQPSVNEADSQFGLKEKHDRREEDCAAGQSLSGQPVDRHHVEEGQSIGERSGHLPNQPSDLTTTMTTFNQQTQNAIEAVRTFNGIRMWMQNVDFRRAEHSMLSCWQCSRRNLVSEATGARTAGQVVAHAVDRSAGRQFVSGWAVHMRPCSRSGLRSLLTQAIVRETVNTKTPGAIRAWEHETSTRLLYIHCAVSRARSLLLSKL